MKTFKSILLITLVGFFFSSTIAQGDIISAADFTKLMKADKSLVVIDASKAETYKKSHIKNAIWPWLFELNFSSLCLRPILVETTSVRSSR